MIYVYLIKLTHIILNNNYLMINRVSGSASLDIVDTLTNNDDKQPACSCKLNLYQFIP